jgi:hypothetical protein
LARWGRFTVHWGRRVLRDSPRMTRVNFQMTICWYLFHLATISQQFLFLSGRPSKSHDRLSTQKVRTTV